MLGVPLVSPRPRAPSPALELSLTSQSLVPLPQAPPPLTSEPQAGGGSHLSPSRTPEREQAGGSGAKRRQTVAGAQRQPPRASQPAPRWGSRRYSPGAVPPPPPGVEEGRLDPSANGYPCPRMGGGAGRSGLWVGRAGPFSPTSVLGPAGARLAGGELSGIIEEGGEGSVLVCTCVCVCVCARACVRTHSAGHEAED